MRHLWGVQNGTNFADTPPPCPPPAVLPVLGSVEVGEVGEDFTVLHWTLAHPQANIEFEVQYMSKTSKGGTGGGFGGRVWGGPVWGLGGPEWGVWGGRES